MCSLLKLVLLTLTLANTSVHAASAGPYFKSILAQVDWNSLATDALTNVIDNIFDRDTLSNAAKWTKDALHKNAEGLLQQKDNNLDLGQQLVTSGEELKSHAESIAEQVVANAKGPRDVAGLKAFKNAVSAIAAAARDVIDTGRGVMDHSKEILDTLSTSVDDVEGVVKDSLGDVGGSIKETSGSVLAAVDKLNADKDAAQSGLEKAKGVAWQGDTLDQLNDVWRKVVETGDLVIEAGYAMQDIGGQGMAVADQVQDSKHSIGQVLKDAAAKLAIKAGFTG